MGEPCTGLIEAKMSLLNRMLRTAGFTAIPLLTLSCFATLAIYVGNSEEFSASFADLLRAYLPYLAILVVVGGLLGVVLSKDGLSRYCSILSALALLLWLQGNILVWDYGVFDGGEIAWMSGIWRGALDTSIWITVLLIAIYAHARVGKTLGIAAIATLAIQTVTAATSVVSSPPETFAGISFESNSKSRDAMLRFSSSKNIVHIVMDGFQSDIFAAIIADQTSGNIAKELQGFTYFTENLGTYPYTQLTVPALLSGKLHRNGIPMDDFVRNTLQGSTILNAAVDSGYEIDIAAPVYLANVYTQGKYTNSYGIAPSDHVTAQDYIRNDSAKLIDLAIFRVVPHFVKALVYRDELWVFQTLIRSESYLQLQYFADLAFLKQLANEMSVDRDVPVYKMIHLMLSHRPFVGNAQCEYDGRKPTNRAAVTTHARCGLTQVLAVLQRMKELGIYDQSLIVLMADHGAWVPVENLPMTKQSDSGVTAMIVAMATPVLAVKPPNSTSDFQISRAPTSIIDVPATIATLAGIDVEFPGQSAFSINSTVTRKRHHLIYGFGINPEAPGYLFPMQEFIVEGSPFDAASWQKATRFPPKSSDRRAAE